MVCGFVMSVVWSGFGICHLVANVAPFLLIVDRRVVEIDAVDDPHEESLESLEEASD